MDAEDVVLTLGIMLAAGLVVQPLADWLRLPRMLLLLGVGALLGPSVLDWIDVPLEAVGSQVLLTLGVSIILFYGGLAALGDGCSAGWPSASACSSSPA